MIPLLVLVESVLAVAAQLCLRRGTERFQSASLTLSIVLEPFRNPYIFSGLSLQALCFFVYIFILSKVRLNVLYPISTGLSVALIALASAALFGERLSAVQLVGIGAIVGGIGLVFTI